MRAVLKQAKELNRDVRIGKNEEDLVSNLRDAVKWGVITREEIYEILCESEESGPQIIYLYLPTSERVKAKCNDGEGIADLLFGKGWQKKEKFPLFHLNPVGEHWADFRVTQVGRGGADWMAKIYAGLYRWNTIEKKEVGDDLFIHRRRELGREIYIAKWHHQGFLELRTPSTESKEQRDASYQAILSSLGRAINFEKDFRPLDLRSTNTTILRQSLTPEGTALFSLPAISGEDDDFAIWRIATRSVQENLSDHGARRKMMEQFLEAGVSCHRLGVVWHLTEDMHGEEKDLLTYNGSYGENSVVIKGKATSKAVRHVVDQLHRLA